ncbi:MAG: LuxR family transcriptional regulator [Dehalococcoidia bacterium]|nr:LuxR family transcriptional regulator [Dehalococcoidia bacterium]
MARPNAVNVGPAICIRDCYSIQVARGGRIPQTQKVPAFAKDGKLHWLSVTYVLVPSAVHGAGALIHIFYEIGHQDNEHTTVAQFLPALPPDTGEIDAANYGASFTLTPREKEILQLMGQGLGTAELASKLVVSVTTVRNHIQSILSKLGVHTRLDAVAYASHKGLPS